jgi:hypothetical protein
LTPALASVSIVTGTITIGGVATRTTTTGGIIADIVIGGITITGIITTGITTRLRHPAPAQPSRTRAKVAALRSAP